MALDAAGALGSWSSGETVAVAIPDLTRPLDPRPALHALSERLRGEMRVVVGLGLHRRLTPSELAPLSPWKPLQHDPDDVCSTGSVDGIPATVFRGVGEAAWSISVGVAELHQYAGISGGHKGVSVGCGGRQTISALHHRDRITAAGVRLGVVDSNPFRAAVDGLGVAAGCRLALVWVPAAGVWIGGEPVAVVREAVRRINPFVSTPRRWSAACLRVPPTKAVSFYQASRAATYLGLSPAPPIEDGGWIFIRAGCPEGLGSESGFIAALASCPPPWSALLTGPAPVGPGAQRAVMVALLAQRFRIGVVGCQSPAALAEVGIAAWAEPDPPVDDWVDIDDPFGQIPQLVGGGPR